MARITALSLLLTLLAIGAAGCGSPETKTCEEYWVGINACVASKQPSGFAGECIYLLPESFPGYFTCEGAASLESFREYCQSAGVTDTSALEGCLRQCEEAPAGMTEQEYLELAADLAGCLGLEGWPMEVSWVPEWLSMKAGEARTVRLRTQKSPPFPIAFDLNLPAADAGKVTVDPGVTVFTPGVHYRTVSVTAGENTSTLLSAIYSGNSVQEFRADLPILVASEEYTCDGQAQGIVGPGGRLEVPGGEGGLAGAFVEFPPDSSLDPVDVGIACAADIVSGDYVPVGPAVGFSPVHQKGMRELTFGIPFNPAMIQAEATPSQVVVFYTGPSVSPRKVPVADAWTSIEGSSALHTFMSPRFGTYQVAIDPMAGKRTFTRHYTYRGITGVSMGGAGAGLVGFRNPERFDFVAPLGGPANWTTMLSYMYRYHLGGFCTAQDGTDRIGEHCPVPPASRLFEFTQEYENWFYPDGRDGQGGTFNREDYCKIFRDLTRGLGNAAFYNIHSTYLPPGVTNEWMKKSPEEKCSPAGVVVLDSFYDWRYNPDGTYPVITFCDGAEEPDDIGKWDPDGTQYVPLDIALAVDVNADGMRNSGEPVIVQPHEPFDDVGVDGVPSAEEAGYDPVTSPDPAGDDYDYQFNPAGLEGNYLYDEGEPYLDYGLDGVQSTPQQDAGGYDWGEGNGRFDYNPNVLNFFAHDARNLIMGMAQEDLMRLDVMADAGIRDLFDFAPGISDLGGALEVQGFDVSLWRNFASLYGAADEASYDSTKVDYTGTMGKNFVLLYGNPDADEALLERGDGGHVGTASQVLNRLMTITMAMSGRWPGGDKEDAVPGLGEDYLMTFDFEAEGRSSQVSIFLPPGYNDARNYDVYYPVIYFLHGYGQQPQDLILSAIVFSNNMISNQIIKEDRMQKLIMVFPDGRCRFSEESSEWERECLKGGFYTDSVWELETSKGPQMETILLDLMDYIDATYRTKPAEDIVVNY